MHSWWPRQKRKICILHHLYFHSFIEWESKWVRKTLFGWWHPSPAIKWAKNCLVGGRKDWLHFVHFSGISPQLTTMTNLRTDEEAWFSKTQTLQNLFKCDTDTRWQANLWNLWYQMIEGGLQLCEKALAPITTNNQNDFSSLYSSTKSSSVS